MEGLLKNLHLGENKSHESQTPTPPTVALPQGTSAPKSGSHGLFNKLEEFSGSVSGHKTPTQTPPAQTVAHPQAAHKSSENLFDKIGDAISGKKTPPPPQVAQPPPNQHHSSSFISQIGGAISGKKTPPPPPPAPKHESMFDKIGDAITGKKTPPPPPKDENLFDKFGNKILGIGQPAAHEQKPQGFGDKLNSVLGGGAKAEMDEGKLDKAIDLFQEHVLKEGAQHNESALEQAKDKQIANAIRHAVGGGGKDNK